MLTLRSRRGNQNPWVKLDQFVLEEEYLLIRIGCRLLIVTARVYIETHRR
jgi:hypothetical protein